MIKGIESIGVVLVVYRKALSKSSSFISLCDLNPRPYLVVVDNSAEPQTPPNYEGGLEYVHFGHNPGVSAAYNEAARRFLKRGFTHLLLLDDDSKLSQTYWKELGESLITSPQYAWFCPRVKDQKGWVSPFKFLGGRGFRPKILKSGNCDLIPINSGSCVKLKAFEEIGGFDENLPLDFSDIDFFIRLKKKGHQGFVLNACLEHELSSEQRPEKQVVKWRFEMLRKSALYFGRKHKSLGTEYFWVALRGVKLAWNYKDFKFIKSLFNAWG